MIVYTADKARFRQDVMSNDIGGIIASTFKSVTGHNTNRDLPAIPATTGVAIEYHLPRSSKRIDFILTGKDAQHTDTAILVELKQWQQADLTAKDGIVVTTFKGGPQETPHPSYQAWTYKCLLQDYNQTVQEEKINLYPCAYLHNYAPDNTITNPFYAQYTKEAPVFLKPDALKLQEFIKRNIKHGDRAGRDGLLYRIDNGKIKPSKNLADSLASMLQGNQEFVMVDDQKIVYETALAQARQAATGQKHVLIVEGGPGTGKSVVAINLLVELTKQEMVAQYVTRNSAPRLVYAAKLAGTLRRTRIDNLFRSSETFHKAQPNEYDCLIVDEAHRLKEKSGIFNHLGENQVKELINAAKLAVFFIDEDQKVTLKDIGDKEEIRRWAKKHTARITELKLESQFRCNGSDGYLAWLARRHCDRAKTGVPVPLQRLGRLPGLAGLCPWHSQSQRQRHAGYRRLRFQGAGRPRPTACPYPPEEHQQQSPRGGRLLLALAQQEGSQAEGYSNRRLPGRLEPYRRRPDLDNTAGFRKRGGLHTHLPGPGAGLRGRNSGPGPYSARWRSANRARRARRQR